jgi:hypothetical protein
MFSKIKLIQVYRVPDAYFKDELPPSRQIVKKTSLKEPEPKKETTTTSKKPQFYDESEDSDEEVFGTKMKTAVPQEEPKKVDKPAQVKKEETKSKKKIVYVDESEDSDWGKSDDSDDDE